MFSTLMDAFHPIKECKILDMGCGHGEMANQLHKKGAVLYGIDSSSDAINFAKNQHTGVEFTHVNNDSLPYQDEFFDGAYFQNSLHHFPSPSIALNEAARVLSKNSTLVIIEPLLRGSYFQSMLPIEDETEVRICAQQNISEFVNSGAANLFKSIEIECRVTFASFHEFTSKISNADVSRSDYISLHKPELEHHFLNTAEMLSGGGFALTQPIKIDILSVL